MNAQPPSDSVESSSGEHQYIVNYDDVEEAVCWRLASSVAVGRVGFVYDDDPIVLPVNSMVVDGRIAFRTAGDSMLHDLGSGVRVAFEADHFDAVAESGWSVLVRGHLWEVVDDELRNRLIEASTHPWVPGPKDRWMIIEPSVVSGRSITRHS
ncbi:MAG TPA: pyridoxamine 5'-phosphate oxidase family protein [Ilumatobacteraceae bacterium]|nr:pyridoxamine 5'-phosphate oxidase family protein [Ilumatobacteraceae bacterium]